MWFSGGERRWPQLSDQLSSHRVTPSSRAILTEPSWPAETGPTPLMDFTSLQRSRNRRSTSRGLYLPATVRPQGLITLSAAYALRSRAGSISHRRRSWDSPFGAFSFRKVPTAFPPRRTHVPFLLSFFRPLTRRAGPTGRGFWVFTLAEVPCQPTRC